MLLSDLYIIGPSDLILEGYGRVLSYPYSAWKVDPSPNALLLGRWRHPKTRNLLTAGLNLNYLDSGQVSRLRSALPAILKDRNLKKRYWNAKALVPDVVDTAYRTYNTDFIGPTGRGTLKFMPKPKKAPPAPPAAPLAAPPTKPPAGMALPGLPTPPVAPAAPKPTSRDIQMAKKAEAEKKKATRGTATKRMAAAKPEEPEETPEETPEEMRPFGELEEPETDK